MTIDVAGYSKMSHIEAFVKKNEITTYSNGTHSELAIGKRIM